MPNIQINKAYKLNLSTATITCTHTEKEYQTFHNIKYRLVLLELCLALKCYNSDFHCQNQFYFVSLAIYSPLHIAVSVTVKYNLKVSLKDNGSIAQHKEQGRQPLTLPGLPHRTQHINFNTWMQARNLGCLQSSDVILLLWIPMLNSIRLQPFLLQGS